MTTFPNSNLTRNQADEEPLGGCATCKSLLLFIYLFLEEDGVEPQLPNKQLSFLFTAPRTRSGRMVRTSKKVVLRLYFLTKVRKTDRIKTLFFSWNVKCRIYCPGNVKRSFYFLYVINNPPPPPHSPLYYPLIRSPELGWSTLDHCCF